MSIARATVAFTLTLLAAAACSPVVESDDISPTANEYTDGKADRFDDAPELELLDEMELEDVLDHPDTARFEASGVAVRDDRILIVFDNLRRFASVDMDLGDAQWLGDDDGYGIEEDDRVEDSRDFLGFEGITVDPWSGRVSLAIEAIEDRDDDLYPVIVHWGDGPTEIEWLDHELESANSGVEGLTHLEVDGVRWLAALCESGKCDGRDRGRILLRDAAGELSRVDLPKGLNFGDFSGLAARGDRLAVTSQESSRIWIGRAYFDEDGALDLETEGVFNFPRQRDGDVDFCTVEGVDWLSDDVLVAVSDLVKDGQKRRCRNHDERIHFFSIPD